MTKPVIFSPAAREDLMAIGLYIARDNPLRAVSFVAELETLADKIAERPLSYAARDYISPGLRGGTHGRYTILFRDLPGCVRIVRVLHGARDLSTLGENGEID